MGLALLSAVIFLAVLAADIQISRTRRDLALQVDALKAKVRDIKKQNSQLQQGIARQDDPQYIEKVAREELDLQKPGEKVFSFVAADSSPSPSAPPSQNFLQSLWGSLRNAWQSLTERR